jgi:16S rRNA (cytosine967-C5)-methyltransferase
LAAGIAAKSARRLTDPARLSACGILFKADAKNIKLERLLSDWAARGNPDERDRAFVSELVYGVTRWARGLDAIIGSVSSRPLKEISRPALIILRIGVYQLMAMDRTPHHAAVNETVGLARADPEAARAAGFVNAVLREIIRRGLTGQVIPLVAEKLLEKAGPTHILLGEKFSFPDWLALRWVERFGADGAERLMQTLNGRAPVTFRVNTLKISPDEMERRFGEWSINAERLDFAPSAYRLTEGKITPGSRMFADGYIQPQDAGSVLAASLLDAKSGDIVVDFCCGVGVKSGAFAQEMENKGMIVCVDSSPAKLFAHRRNMRRLAVKICVTAAVDGSKPWPLKGRFAKIFIDAPCTGTGVLRRHPEGKWNTTEESVARMAGLQREILKNAVDALAPGGVLVYAVCSIEPEEGVDVVNSVLAGRDDLQRSGLKSSRPGLERFLNADGDLFILPGDEGMDGFYASRLVKAVSAA